MSLFKKVVRAKREWPLRVAVLGCSGSVGSQTLDVCRQHADKIKVVALSVNVSCDLLVSAAREFSAAHVAVADPSQRDNPALSELPAGCELGFGMDAVNRLAELDDVDMVVNALLGEAGVSVGYAALKAGKSLAYANKESIVTAGELLMPLVKPGQLIPVDSEHSAIFQCLVGEDPKDVERIWLTCSGGPFYGMSREELASVSLDDAMAHPTWAMGEKITIDSATLMNKGLEVIEAHHLFDVAIDDIRVLVQRQSRIHSMVEFVDGSVKAQLGPSDMRIPIQYALSYPERWEAPGKRTNWCHEAPITFGEADEETFGCLAIAKQAGRVGGTMPCAVNAANEIANAAFREGACSFLDIERVVAHVMDATTPEPLESLEQLHDVDERSREMARESIRTLEG